jgi:hypothetical protein
VLFFLLIIKKEGFMDPILDDELKQSRRMKLYQQYQEHLDQTDKKDMSEPSGKMQGKKIKKITSDNPRIENVFNGSTKKIS